jgi:L-aminopeptidase/D-esterase-like protein
VFEMTEARPSPEQIAGSDPTAVRAASIGQDRHMSATPTGPPSDWAPFGSITDVSGIRVGHHQRTGRGWRTGTTVVVAPSSATPGVDVRGGGPGTRETEALRPENLVQRIHAICLTGGSAYGLAAADGVVAELEAAGLGFPVGPPADDWTPVVPVVPAAVVFDLGRAGEPRRTFSRRPDAEFGRRAAARALRGRTPSWGSVGAGAGARAGGLQGGVGTASTVVEAAGTAVAVGALAVVNANGSVVDPATAAPWEPAGLTIAPSRREAASVRRALTAPPAGLNTTIGVVATSAVLSKAESTRLAAVGHDGLARAIRPAHAMVDGDTIFALATGRHDLDDIVERAEADGSPPTGSFGGSPTRVAVLDRLLAAAADTFAAACTHALLAATSHGDPPAWRDLCPRTAASVERRK